MPFTEILILISFTVFIAVFVLLRWEPRIAIGAALLLLVISAITSAIGKDGLAEQLAIYAFYFLASGVMLSLIQYVRESRKEKERSEIRSTEIFRTTDQMTRAKAVQDELRQRLQSWSGTEHLKTWPEERIQILDASVIICWFSEEPSTAKALEVRQKILDGQVKVLIPDFGFSQVIHALRSNPRLSDDDVVTAFKSLNDIGLGIAAVTPRTTEAASKLVYRYKINIYEALYVALANELEADLLTADEALYRNTQQLRFVKFVGDLDEPKDVKS